MHSEQDLKYAAELREELHREALARVRAFYPDADRVVDPYPVEAYFREVWDYPGKWYTVAGIPSGAGSRKELMEAIVRETLEAFRKTGPADLNGAFRRLMAEYPEVVCDYCLIDPENRYAKEYGVFPYRGAASHRPALACAARELFAEERPSGIQDARCRKLSGKALFAPTGADEWLNYRKAFLCPPQGNPYTDDDFRRVNAVLFPGGAEGLEVYRWTTDWSEYFDEGHEWWGALCLTVYDKTLDRFVVILASATD